MSHCIVRSNRRLVGLVATMMFIASSPMTYGQNGAVGIAYPARGITVDGDLSDWPKGLRDYPIDRIEFGDKLAGKDDLKAHFRIAYNAGERAALCRRRSPGRFHRPRRARGSPCGTPRIAASSSSMRPMPAADRRSSSMPATATRTGSSARWEPPRRRVKVAVVRTDTRIVYEWRIEVGAELDPDRTIGFDVSVADKDKDGSFSWAAWGSGTQKAETPDRCGEFFLVRPETRFGEVSGLVTWKDPSQAVLPSRVRIQSARVCARLGARRDRRFVGGIQGHDLPRVLLRPARGFGGRPRRCEDELDVRVDCRPPGEGRAPPRHAAPWPGLIGDEGVLRSPGPVNPEELDRFVQAYLEYYKIPGISVAVIKDSRVVYHRGFGVKNTATAEPVTRDTVFEAASMTKPVFAYTVLRLVDRGVLKLDTPLYTYLPYPDIADDDRYKLITARMVLTHRTGFPQLADGKARHQVHPRHRGLVFRRRVRLPRQGRREPHRQELVTSAARRCSPPRDRAMPPSSGTRTWRN